MAAMAALMLFDTGRCIAHRSAVVAALRITGTAVQLAHRYLDPGERWAAKAVVSWLRDAFLHTVGAPSLAVP